MPPSSQKSSLPPSVDVGLSNDDLRSYWWSRVLQHVKDNYAGVLLCKFPEGSEDL